NGLRHTRDRVVRRELKLAEEGMLDLGDYRQTRLRLEELGIFDRIALRPTLTEGGRADLAVDLAERHGFGDPLQLGLNSGIYALRKKVVLRYFNLAGEGINLGVDYK